MFRYLAFYLKILLERWLLCVEFNQSAYCSLAYRTEFGVLVGAHAAVEGGTVDTLRRVTATLIDTYGVFFLQVNRCGVGGAFGQHVLPFGGEIYLCGNVLLPGFYVEGVAIGHYIIVVEVFVAQTAEAVSKLMDYNWTKHRMVSRGKGVGVVNAATSILVGIGQDDDVLVVYTGQRIMDGLYLQGGEISVGIEGAEVGSEGGLFPFA